MAKPILNEPQFQTEAGAFAYVEARLWPNGPVCPHCGGDGSRWRAERQDYPPRPLQVLRLPEALHRANGHHLRGSATCGLHLWLQVIHLMCASKKGIAPAKFSGC